MGVVRSSFLVGIVDYQFIVLEVAGGSGYVNIRGTAGLSCA
jgi:hypothetical protein